MNNPAYRIGAILYAIVMGFFGANHLLNAGMMQSAVPAFLPGGIIWVYVTGAAFVVAAIAIIINSQSRLAAYLLALMLLIFVGAIHVPAYTHATDVMAKAMAMTNLLKDIALAGAALMIAGYGK